MKRIFLTLFFTLIAFPAHAATILASTFNATYNATNPLTITETTIINLDENIVIDFDGAAEIIQPGMGFNTTLDEIVFTSSSGNKVIITQQTTWKFSANTRFTGNAQLQTQRGATLWHNNANLTLDGTPFTQIDPT